MDSSSYQRYLASREWAVLREAIRERSGSKCERCLFRPMTAVHHVTYERIGHEHLADLMAICDPCHEWLSGKRSRAPSIGTLDAMGHIALDPEKAATTTAIGHRVCGVLLDSRHNKQHEYDAMIEVVRSLPPALARRVKSIFCDSNAGSCYEIDGEISQADLDAIAALFFEKYGGHNGVRGPGGLYVDPDWNEP